VGGRIPGAHGLGDRLAGTRLGDLPSPRAAGPRQRKNVSSGEWVPVPYVDEGMAEELFRHKVLGLLRHRGLQNQDRIELLLSWRRSGFSVHNRVYAHPGHPQGAHRPRAGFRGCGTRPRSPGPPRTRSRARRRLARARPPASRGRSGRSSAAPSPAGPRWGGGPRRRGRSAASTCRA
jgi:hypothetical protein